MFGFYPRPQPAYNQPSPYYASAVAQQQQQARARAYAEELARQRAARSRYLPDDDDYEPQSDDEDCYLTPHQRALLQARRRQEAIEQRRLEAVRLAQENALKRQRAEIEKHRASQTAADSTEPQSALPRRSVSPLVSHSPPPRSPSPPAPQVQPTPSPEHLDEAATKIQTQYRIHRALRTITALAAQFDSLKSSFVPPTTIDYQADGRVVSVPVATTIPDAEAPSAKLAFTSTNVPLHTYSELLSRLLVSLDAVESRGDARVRDRRRAVVRAVEAEAARVEAFWRSVWAAHQRRGEEPEEAEESEVRAMVVDEPTPVPELARGPESESEEDDTPDFATPSGSPESHPAVLSEPDSLTELEDGVLVDVHPEDEEKDFVIVPEQFSQ